MNEDATRLWMKALAGDRNLDLPVAEHLWMLSQLEAQAAPRRQTENWLRWVDAAVQSVAGLAIAAISLAVLVA